MRRAGRGGLAAALTAGIALALAGPSPAGLRIGFADPLFSSQDAGVRATWLENAEKSRSDIVRIDVSWRAVAPGAEPADPSNPAAYDWGALPAAVADAEARGLKVLLTVSKAPAWAEAAGRPGGVLAGTWKPDPDKFGQFARALGAQFSPGVRYYQAWNEPNIYTFLNPQYVGKKPFAAEHYRRMLNAFYAGVHAVHPGALVVSGGTAPYGGPPGSDRTRPLAFLRDLLCLKGRKKLKPVKCATKAKFDALAHHPINTSGGPNRSALHPDDVATPDVKFVVRTLRKAERSEPGGDERPPSGLADRVLVGDEATRQVHRDPEEAPGAVDQRGAALVQATGRQRRHQLPPARPALPAIRLRPRDVPDRRVLRRRQAQAGVPVVPPLRAVTAAVSKPRSRP